MITPTSVSSRFSARPVMPWPKSSISFSMTSPRPSTLATPSPISRMTPTVCLAVAAFGARRSALRFPGPGRPCVPHRHSVTSAPRSPPAWRARCRRRRRCRRLMRMPPISAGLSANDVSNPGPYMRARPARTSSRSVVRQGRRAFDDGADAASRSSRTMPLKVREHGERTAAPGPTIRSRDLSHPRRDPACRSRRHSRNSCRAVRLRFVG